MENLQTVTRYGRWELRCGSGTSSVRICSPSGVVTERSCFLRQPGRLVTDDHGYESVIPAGEPCFCVRYTPTEAGIYTYESDNGESGCFLSEEAGLHGYVRVSEKDPRYFCFTDGTPFPVIGMNLASLTAYPQTVKREFGLTDERAYLGIREYERWFRKLSEAGGNHARIWLGQEYLCVDTDDPEAPDLLQFEKVDALVALARKYGIYLKLSFDQFRFFGKSIYDDVYDLNTKRIFQKRFVLRGRECSSMTEWLSDEAWQNAWISKVRQYLLRYGGDPIVFAFEFWNEMNAVEADYDLVIRWNRKMASILPPMAPENMWCQSIGSMDSAGNTEIYDRFPFSCFSFSQFHRYLDQGASLPECRTDGFAFTKSGIATASRPGMPVLLAETGAVNDCHSGPFRYYMSDDRGILFVDTVYPAAFLGAAGCGQIWHWGLYVENKQLFPLLTPLKEAFSGVDPASETFQVFDLSADGYYAACLMGQHSVLGFLRNRSDGWRESLLEGRETIPLPDITLNLNTPGELRTIPIWADEPGMLFLHHGVLECRNLKYGLVFRIMRDEAPADQGGTAMKQLMMIRKPQPLQETLAPAGCTVRTWKDESDTDIWVAMCKEGILAPDADRGEWERLVFSRKNIIPRRDVFFFDLDGKPASTVTAVINEDTKTGMVHMVDSFPWARGRGIGTYMMFYVLRHMIDHGMEWIELTTDDWRIPAIRSYLHRGFLPVNNDVDMAERWTAVLNTIGAKNVEMLKPDRSFDRILCP